MPVLGVAAYAQVAAGSSHTCARLRDGTVSCWGASGLFADRKGDSGVPTQVFGIDATTDVAAGTVVDCALASGALTCWGGDHYVGWQIGGGYEGT
jgi:hypothetical protein